jgi:hypothetical protein
MGRDVVPVVQTIVFLSMCIVFHSMGIVVVIGHSSAFILYPYVPHSQQLWDNHQGVFVYHSSLVVSLRFRSQRQSNNCPRLASAVETVSLQFASRFQDNRLSYLSSSRVSLTRRILTFSRVGWVSNLSLPVSGRNVDC